MNTEEMIKVMQAFVEGKPIEWRFLVADGSWGPVPEDPMWNWKTTEYRIKPQVITKEMYLFKDGSMAPTDMYTYDLTKSLPDCKKVTITYTL